MFLRGLFLRLERAHARKHLVPVDFVSVEFRAVDADELRLAADRHAATAAHAGAVDHDRVERHRRLDAVGLRGEGAELHHDGRADSDDFVNRAGFAELLQGLRHEALAAGASVVGHENQVFAGDCSHLVLHDEEAFVPGAHDDRHLVARGLERLGDRVHRGDSNAAANANDMSRLFAVFAANRGGASERAEKGGDGVAGLEARKLRSRCADRLEDDGYCAFFDVGVGNCERNSLAELVVCHQDYELPRLALLRDERRLDLHLVDVVGQPTFRYDSVHGAFCPKS